MKSEGGGHIVNTASAVGFINLPEMGPYNLVKAGVISLSETLRAELAPQRIGVTVVCPTFFGSNLAKTMTCADESQREEAKELFASTKTTAGDVASRVVEAVDRNRLYVLPQFGARFWRFFKGLAPSASTDMMALMYGLRRRAEGAKRG